MARFRIVGLFLGLCASAGCSSSSNDDTQANTESATTVTSNGQTANTTAVTQATATAATVTATTSSSTAAAGGSGGAGTEGTSTAAGDTTGVGGGAGNANATTDTGTTAAGGSGGEGGAGCPNEPPNPDSSCASPDQLCAYEDCAGVGRTVASCVSGAWSVTTSACGETVECSAGGGQCSQGEICLIRAGGAFLQECVPNTCESGPVECDCIEGCSGECATHGSPEAGITITCNTCPSGFACP